MDDLRLDLWRETADGRATLINLSENHTFRIDAPAGRTVLRVHRPGYQSAASIESELSWLEALRRDTDLPVVRPLPGRDGRLLQRMGDRHAVLFAFEEGREPVEGDIALFATIGAFAAKAHLHVAAWTPPEGFVRPTWSVAAMLEPDGLWGDWRLAPGVGSVRPILDAVAARLHIDLAAYGAGPDRFGLIHADMRLANLLVDREHTTLLDFDDCGFGWFMYDLGAALSFIDTAPDALALRTAWLAGYTALRPLADADLVIIDAMVLLRRMVLLAWIGTHGETLLAQAHVKTFAADTARVGRAWLDQG
ncbi:MAG: hypothetical protein EOP19_05140 [Hyphomicrobiales bacterium]|nr:MAG: hypothetical protein EOP19_05140 [Hyphomicrobiales bacterium]